MEYVLFFSRPFFRENSADERIYQLHGIIDGGSDRLAEAHLSFFRAERCRHAADEQNSFQLRAHVYRHAQHVYGVHTVRIYKTRLSSGGIQSLQIRFDDEEGAGLALTGIGVHKDGGFVAFHQCVCKIKSADAKVRHANAMGERAAFEFARDFDAEAVVTQKNVAYPSDQDTLRFDGGRLWFLFGEGLDFGGREEKTVARLSHQA